jgi:hypothetical protein
VVLHDDCLLAGILAGQKDHHLPGLQSKQMVSAQGFAARCCRLEKSTAALPPLPHLQELHHFYQQQNAICLLSAAKRKS